MINIRIVAVGNLKEKFSKDAEKEYQKRLSAFSKIEIVETKEFKYGFPCMPMRMKQVGNVHVPNSMRTVAESYDNKKFSYTYCGVGGLSWGIPYAVGLLAIGQQINKDMPAIDLKNVFIETASENECIVTPDKFVERVKTFSKEFKEIVNI